MDAKGDTHYRGNAVLVPTFLALYFFFSFFCTFLCGGNVGLLFSHRFFFEGVETYACGAMESPRDRGEMVWRGRRRRNQHSAL
jgi:hypothetical protein